VIAAPASAPAGPRACEACGSTDHRASAQLDAATRILRCRRCGLRSVDPLPRWDAAKDDFAELDLERWVAYMEQFRRAQYRRDLAMIQRWHTRGRVLDIGCSTGFFLDEARARGFEARGIEASPTAAGYATQRFGLDVVQGEFERVDVEEAAFDVVTLFAVLEHMAHPARVIARAAKALRPGGLLVVKVPRSDSLIAHAIYGLHRVSGGGFAAPLRSLYDWDYRYPHLYHFSTASLRRLLANAGLRVLAHRAESSINLAQFDDRLSLTEGEARADLGWARSRPVRWAITAGVRCADLCRWGDDVIVYARK
jgi:SAM-dependent methyltransferase